MHVAVQAPRGHRRPPGLPRQWRVINPKIGDVVHHLLKEPKRTQMVADVAFLGGKLRALDYHICEGEIVAALSVVQFLTV